MPRRPNTQDRSTIKSASRTLEIFEFFRDRQCPATVNDVALALRIPQSSTSMLLKSLVTLNYLDYRPKTRCFIPTFRVNLLGSWIGPRYDNDALTQIMEEIRRETRETVLLGLQSGPSIQYVHILEANFALQLTARVGTIRPMTLSAVGKILLSQKTEAQIRAIVRRNNADTEDPCHRVHEDEFLKEIELVREQGYAESRGRMAPGANVIAMLATTDETQPPLAIGVGGPLSRIDASRASIIDIMRCRLSATRYKEPYDG